MRMIDADELRKQFPMPSDMSDPSQALVHITGIWAAIDCTPTVEPKKGKWIVFSSPDEYHCGMVKCPFCSEELIAEANEYNYCPNCGARMENGDDRN